MPVNILIVEKLGSIKSLNWNSVNFNINQYCQKVLQKVLLMTLGHVCRSSVVEVSLLLTDDNDLQHLNKKFRNKDKTTNVLSFPFYQYHQI